MEERLVAKCEKCGLNQFVLRSRKCRRCHEPLNLPTFESLKEEYYRPIEKKDGMNKYQRQYADMSSRVRFFRVQKGMTTRQLSQAARISLAQISKIENGHSDLSMAGVEKILFGLSITAQDFFAEDISFILSDFEIDLVQARRTLPPSRFLEVMSVIEDCYSRQKRANLLC